jgi:hypothetical protein
VLYAVAHPRGTLTEGDAADPVTVVALQQRGIIRRRPRAGYLELTDDARFSLTPESAVLCRRILGSGWLT